MGIPVSNLSQPVVGVCCGHSDPKCRAAVGMVAQGAVSVTANGLPVTRLTDLVVLSCGHTALVIYGSPTVTVEGLPISHMTDPVGGVFTGMIVAGSPNVIAG